MGWDAELACGWGQRPGVQFLPPLLTCRMSWENPFTWFQPLSHHLNFSRIYFTVSNAAKQLLEAVSPSSGEQHIEIKVQETFAKCLSCSAVVALEKICLRTKLSACTKQQKKGVVHNSAIAESFQQFFPQIFWIIYTLCICSLTSVLVVQIHLKVWPWVFTTEFSHNLTGKTQRRNLVSNLGFVLTLFYYTFPLRNHQS